MTAVAIVLVLALPVAALLALLHMVNVVHARRQQVIARQIALTDAIHGVLGPVVAPVVRRRRRGWVGVLAVPSGHPQMGTMVEIAQAELGPTAEIVLVPREPLPARARPELDEVGGPEMAAQTPRRSARRGGAVARLDTRGAA